MTVFERAHRAYLDNRNPASAIRCAFWLGLHLLLGGERSRARGWLARGHRLLTRYAMSCAEEGYLLLPAAEEHLSTGRCEAAYEAGTTAVEIGERFEDAELTACARHVQGRALLDQGRIEEGVELLDEVMVAVTSGELSPVITGLLYCSIIDACWGIWALERGREWTSALSQWCLGQQGMVAFTGTCLSHRAEIMQLDGAWAEALKEARVAVDRFSRGIDRQPPAAAMYQQAEIHRIRGHFVAAEEAYRCTSHWGGDPQPGLALLRLAQGRIDAGAAAIRRALYAVHDRLPRTRLLPAYVEILLARGDTREARHACHELNQAAACLDTPMLRAWAAYTTGAVDLADGKPQAAVASLRRAWQAWQRMEGPYMTARARTLTGLACRALGDGEGAQLEFAAARAIFDRLGAAPDIAKIDSLGAEALSSSVHHRGLTARELQVLRLLATGESNRSLQVNFA